MFNGRRSTCLQLVQQVGGWSTNLSLVYGVLEVVINAPKTPILPSSKVSIQPKDRGGDLSNVLLDKSRYGKRFRVLEPLCK